MKDRASFFQRDNEALMVVVEKTYYERARRCRAWAMVVECCNEMRESVWFQRVILMTIVANSIWLAIDDAE